MPVIGIGVPTVVGAGTIVHDAVAGVLESLEESEMDEFLGEVISPALESLYVTTKEIDEMVRPPGRGSCGRYESGIFRGTVTYHEYGDNMWNARRNDDGSDGDVFSCPAVYCCSAVQRFSGKIISQRGKFCCSGRQHRRSSYPWM